MKKLHNDIKTIICITLCTTIFYQPLFAQQVFTNQNTKFSIIEINKTQANKIKSITKKINKNLPIADTVPINVYQPPSPNNISNIFSVKAQKPDTNSVYAMQSYSNNIKLTTLLEKEVMRVMETNNSKTVKLMRQSYVHNYAWNDFDDGNYEDVYSKFTKIADKLGTNQYYSRRILARYRREAIDIINQKKTEKPICGLKSLATIAGIFQNTYHERLEKHEKNIINFSIPKNWIEKIEQLPKKSNAKLLTTFSKNEIVSAFPILGMPPEWYYLVNPPNNTSQIKQHPPKSPFKGGIKSKNSSGYSFAELAEIVHQNSSLTALQVRVDFTTLTNIISPESPAIIHWKINDSQFHFMVADGVESKKNYKGVKQTYVSLPGEPKNVCERWGNSRKFPEKFTGYAMVICTSNKLVALQSKLTQAEFLSPEIASTIIGGPENIYYANDVTGGNRGAGGAACGSCNGGSSPFTSPGSAAFPAYELNFGRFEPKIFFNIVKYDQAGNSNLTFRLSYYFYPYTKSETYGKGWSISKRRLKGAEIVYDSKNKDRIKYVIDNLGRTNIFSYNNDGQLSVFECFKGLKWFFSYNSNGNLTKVIGPTGATTEFEYDNEARITAITTELGTTRYRYFDDKYGMLVAWQIIYDKGNTRIYERQPDIVKESYYAVGYDKPLEEKTYDLTFHSPYSPSTPANNMLDTLKSVKKTIRYNYNNKIVITTQKGGKPVIKLSYKDNQSKYTANNMGQKTVSKLPHKENNNFQIKPKNEPNIMMSSGWEDHSEHYTNALGYITKYYYNADDNLIGIEDELHRTTLYYYAQSTLTNITLPNGASTSFILDTFGRAIKTIYPGGIEIGTEYDNIDRPIRTVFLSENAQSGQRNIDGHPYTENIYCAVGMRKFIDRIGGTTEYDYDFLGRLIRITDADNNSISYQYDEDGDITHLTDGNGHTTKFIFDDYTPFINPKKYLKEIIYPSDNDSKKKTFSNIGVKNVIASLPDSGDFTLRIENGRTAGWYRTSFGYNFYYNANENGTIATNAGIVAIGKEYHGTYITTPNWYEDSSDNINIYWGYDIEVTDEDNNSIDYFSDIQGQICYTETYDKKIYYNFMTDGNINKIEYNDYDSINFLYDKIGQMICESNRFDSKSWAVNYSYDPVGNRTNFQFNAYNSQFAVTNNYAYDYIDRLTNIYNPTYDIGCDYEYSGTAGYLNKKIYNNSVHTEYNYSSIGQLQSLQHKRTNDIINEYNYDYNSAQMIDSITRNQQQMSFAYDKIYQLTDEQGKYINNFSSPSTITVTNQFDYDNAGNRIFSDNLQNPLKEYNNTIDNQLTEIKWNENYITLHGEIQQAWTANYVKVKQDTAASWSTAEIKCNSPFSKGGKGDLGGYIKWTAQDVPYSGTNTINFQIICETPDGQQCTNVVSYNKTSSSSYDSITYQYDNRGNRTQKNDINNRTTTYTYDLENQLTEINGYDKNENYFSYEYKYDALGRRVKAICNNVTRYYCYDGLDLIYVDGRRDWESSMIGGRFFVRGTGLGGGIGDVIAEVKKFEMSGYPDIWNPEYYYYNHRGDVVLDYASETGAEQYSEYDAFGNVISSIGSLNPYLTFSSKEFDKRSELSYYGFRYYDPESGRWMKKDPLLWKGGLNLYAFVNNNPVNKYDIYGYVFGWCPGFGTIEHGIKTIFGFSGEKVTDYKDCKPDSNCPNDIDKAVCVACINIKLLNYIKDYAIPNSIRSGAEILGASIALIPGGITQIVGAVLGGLGIIDGGLTTINVIDMYNASSEAKKKYCK